MQCPMCLQVNNPEILANRIIHEFEHGIWYLANNQFYYGYSILMVKKHVREWHEIPLAICMSLNENLRAIASTIQQKLNPHKINLASLGNIVEHLHWHIIPRYLSDPNHTMAPDFTLPDSLTEEMIADLRSKFMN